MFDVHVTTYPTKLGEFPIYPTYQVVTMGAPKSSQLLAWECYERVYRQWHSHHFVMNMINISFTRIQCVQVFNGRRSHSCFFHSSLQAIIPPHKNKLQLRKTHRASSKLLKWQVGATNFEKIHLLLSCNSEKSKKNQTYLGIPSRYRPISKPTSTAVGEPSGCGRVTSTIHSDTNPVRSKCSFKFWKRKFTLSFHFRFTTLVGNQGLFLTQRFKLFMADLQGLYGSLARK